MHNRLVAFVPLAVAGLTAAAALGAGDPLSGKVGPGYTIRLLDASGAAVTALDPGSYRFVVDDVAEEHNFHLSGPGVDQTTSVEGTGTFTWDVSLRDGVYTFVCDPHFTTMRGTIRVGTGGATPTTTTATPRAPAPGRRYVARVGPGSTISLRTTRGARVRTIERGPVTLLVQDRSSTLNFHLSGNGIDRRTGIVQRADVTWKLSLRPGILRFRSDTGPARLRGSVRIR